MVLQRFLGLSLPQSTVSLVFIERFNLIIPESLSLVKRKIGPLYLEDCFKSTGQVIKISFFNLSLLLGQKGVLMEVTNA